MSLVPPFSKSKTFTVVVEVGMLIIGNDEYLMVDEEQRQMVVVVCVFVCVWGGGVSSSTSCTQNLKDFQ